MIKQLQRTGFVLCWTFIFGSQIAQGAGVDEQMTKFYELSKANRTAEAIAMLKTPGFATVADSDGHNPLIVAASTGNEQLLDAVLKTPQDLNHADAKGCTAVWFMSGVANPALLKKLLQRGASATKACSNGLTPLMAAAMANRPEVVQILLDAKAPADTENDGATALGYAVTAGHDAVATALLKAGANPGATMSGNKLINIARNRGFKKMESLLRTYGAS